MNNNNKNSNSIHLHRNHSSIRNSCGRNSGDQQLEHQRQGNGCTLLSSPDSHDTAPILPGPGRRDVGVGCNRLLGLAPLATACTSSAASSFYSSMLGGAADCSISLRSRDRSSLTPGRNSQSAGKGNRLATRFQHSKSHSIASSPRETTPVRHSAVISVRGGSEKFSDRQKTASLPLPKRRQLSLSATDACNAGGEEPACPPAHVNIANEETYTGSSLAADNCSFDTATSGICGGQQHARDSSCTLDSNSYKEQYILGCGHYRSNLKHYDALLAGGGCVAGEARKPHDDLAMVELGGTWGGEKANASTSSQQQQQLDDRELAASGTKEKIATVQPKTHHYPTNAKSLEDIL
uniref:Uncharacterized protein n=1 Tax=Anopheles farauti TaxID=69004 RepID=A0A182PZN9_9DIPT